MDNKEEKKYTPISDLGEFGLIKHLTKHNETKHSSTIYSIGDDAAVLEHKGKSIVVSTDTLIEGVHFDLAYSPLKYLGYKSVIVSLSDIYAMNATPKQMTFSIAVSNRFSVEALEDLYQGVYEACKTYSIDMVGGDTTSSLSGLVISVTAIGEVNHQKVCYRKGAKHNDIICVSGELGSAYLGLLYLEREKEVYNTTKQQPKNLEANQHVIKRFLRPEARKDIVEYFENQAILPTSMIDISDGLSSELLHICESSGVSCEVFEDKMPHTSEALNIAKEMNLEIITCMMNGGEDYELLFTINQKDYKKIQSEKSIHPIGYIKKKGEKPRLITSKGDKKELKALGWKYFDPNPLRRHT